MAGDVLADARTFSAAILLNLACASSPAAPDQKLVPNGVWGGEHIGMEVSATGAQLEFDCAHGRIEEPLTLGESGRFEVNGTYTQERPGPRREDENGGRPVRYVGSVEGESMRLTVHPAGGTSEAIGSFALELGRTPVIRKCL